MGNKPIDKALDAIPNRFLLTTVVARRWENIVAGAPPLIDSARSDSRLEVVLDEIVQERVSVDSETREIQLQGAPQVEDCQEALFSAPIGPEPSAPAPKSRG